MPRAVIEYAPQGLTGGADTDGYTDKVVKYVPADVVAAWTAVVAVIKAASGLPTTILGICFAGGLVLTALWTWLNIASGKQPRWVRIKQTVVAVVAFVVWVLALGDLNDYLATFPLWNAAYAKILLIVFTVISGKI